MFRQMKVTGLVMDPHSNTPILVLKDVADETTLPIWIGLLEATAIATELENIQFPRPMTHDLIRAPFRPPESQSGAHRGLRAEEQYLLRTYPHP